MYLGRRPEQGAACPFICCDHMPQTLTHSFVTCPSDCSLSLAVGVVCAAATDTAAGATGHRPQLLASVLLVDVVRVWRPAAAQHLLWTHVRLAMLHALCSVICRARMHGEQTMSGDVAPKIFAACRCMIARHRLRVGTCLSRSSPQLHGGWRTTTLPSLQRPS